MSTRYGWCPYCGARCRGTTCAEHADLPALDRELPPDVQAIIASLWKSQGKQRCA